MEKNRRKFLKDSGLLTGGLVLANSKGVVADDELKVNTDKDIIICVFQRGAADGLHSVVPHAEPDYFNRRPQTAVNDSIDLDGFFGLNPNLSALKAIWDNGDLGIVHAVGSNSDSRSHFEAQDTMEYADLDNNAIRTGWLSKFLTATKASDDTVFKSISLNNAVQKSILGEVETLTLSSLSNFDILTHEEIYGDTKQTMSGMFNNSDIFSDTSSVLVSAIDTIKQINPNDFPIDNGAVYPNSGFASKLRSLGVIIKAELGTQIVCVDIGGWDHHNDIGSAYPNLAQNFSNALLAFYQDMGERMNNITVLCMTEFGRRIAENASGGTDHGHGGVMYAIGKQVNGGQVYADWPGLDEGNQNRGDLEVTTDFREVFSELLLKRLKYSGTIEDIIPDYDYQGGIGLFKSE